MKTRTALLGVLLTASTSSCIEKPVAAETPIADEAYCSFLPIPETNVAAIRTKAREALAFCSSKGYNTSHCILINMGLHSGLNRFYIWDFKRDTFCYAFPVSHGCCDKNWNDVETKETPTFSNTDGSHCSSLGRYKIGERGYSDWGIHVKYLMHGLDKTNSNALARQIVLHSWEQIPDNEVFPDGTPEGWGCPALSNQNMKQTDSILKASAKPVLMWIYNQ